MRTNVIGGTSPGLGRQGAAELRGARFQRQVRPGAGKDRPFIHLSPLTQRVKKIKTSTSKTLFQRSWASHHHHIHIVYWYTTRRPSLSTLFFKIPSPPMSAHTCMNHRVTTGCMVHASVEARRRERVNERTNEPPQLCVYQSTLLSNSHEWTSWSGRVPWMPGEGHRRGSSRRREGADTHQGRGRLFISTHTHTTQLKDTVLKPPSRVLF